LDNAEGRVSKGGTSQENHKDTYDVDTELELKEFANVIEDVSSPEGSVENRVEVIVQEDDLRGFFSNISSRAHTKSNICLFQGLGVSDALSSNCNFILSSI
jgi:predicted regulator of amino acid metabolism with ACT domain